MFARPVRALVLVLPLVLGTVACGSDSDSPPAKDTPADTVADSPSNESSGNAEVDAYCKAVDAYAAEAKKLIADPGSVDATALSAQSTDLVTKAAALAGSVTGDDVARLEECNSAFAGIGG